MKKYNKDHIFSNANNLEVTVSQTGSTAMIREKDQEKATKRQGFRVVVSGETVNYGSWDQSERELLLDTIKHERYAHLAYKEEYYDLLQRLASIGLVQVSDSDDDRL